MIRQNTYKKAYYDKWSPYQASWDQLVAKNSENWRTPFDAPDVGVSKWLHFSLMCLFADDLQRAPVFLERAVDNADRLIAEDRFHDTEVAEAGFPASLGRTIRDRAYARWLLGEPLDHAALREASCHMIEWCLHDAEVGEGFASDLTMDRYLQGVRCSLTGGDVARARELAQIRQRFEDIHATQQDLWVRLTNEYPEVNDSLRSDVEAFFDRIREPDFSGIVDGVGVYVARDALRLDTGIIRQMYLMNPSLDNPVDPRAVIEAIAQ